MREDLSALRDEALDGMAEIIDLMDNYLGYSHNPFMEIVQLKEAYLTGLVEARKQLFEVYTRLGGEDFWLSDTEE